ncbi:MAG: sigma-70 family RNA polymerase sigma factor [Clostridia bacterium]|nr:sigma-70 family RNA polymerase sigma factor [Clostridia bacterium]
MSNWLYTIARNLYLDHTRKSGRHNNQPLSKETEFKDYSTDPQKILDNKELNNLIQKILLQLPESQRTVLILRDHLGLSYWEIAQITGKSVSSVKSSLFRGRLAFKELYTKEELERG